MGADIGNVRRPLSTRLRSSKFTAYDFGIALDAATLVVGTGDLSYDADVASALGVGLLVLADSEQRETYVARRAGELGATLVGVVTEDGLEAA
ncbi:hypothetical protein [Corynebacterium mayonis]|uniref:hypothetical protein n=1 Tax=Corynebacterium mayonis TaxID=3062461 RepID=UPI0031400DCC